MVMVMVVGGGGVAVVFAVGSVGMLVGVDRYLSTYHTRSTYYLSSTVLYRGAVACGGGGGSGI